MDALYIMRFQDPINAEPGVLLDPSIKNFCNGKGHSSIYPVILGFTSYAQRGTGCFQPDEYQRAG
jgi:hypothetical protein